jgi:hypothetical protein
MRWEPIVVSFAVGCGGGGESPSQDAAPDAATCVRAPASPDRVRHVVVGHPYADGSTKSNVWEVLDLSAAGELSRPGRTFTMGRAITGELTFTLDGAIGVAAQEDGSVGVFKIDAEGVPTVLHAAFKGAFYAARVTTAPDGSIYVLDDQWRENGGGIYKLSIDCDDNVTDGGLVAASKLPSAIAFLPGGSAIVSAADIATSPMGAEAHLLVWGDSPTYTTSTDAFADDEAIVGGAALTADNQWFMIGDTSSFASVPNRVAAVPVTSTGFGTVEMIPDVEDPLTLIADPARLQVLAVSGFGDALFVLDRPSTTWRKTEVTYSGAKPQLPGGAVMIRSGTLAGRVLVAENLGVRQVRFTASGVEDLGLFSLGSGIENSTGAIGVTP